MTLRDYYNELTLFIKNNPNSMDLDIICSTDPEGNEFWKIDVSPGIIGHFEPYSEGNMHGDFQDKKNMEEDGWLPDEMDLNAICIN